LYDEIVR